MPQICPACQTSNDDSAEVCFNCRYTLIIPITRGSVVGGRYEVVETLGKGGMGIVYKAHDRTLDEAVALKVLRPDVAQSPDIARRFRAEIRLARKVGHRNVCRIFEYGEEGGFRYISMEFIDGVDLKHVLRLRGALPAQEAYEVAIQVTLGLGAIHDLGIIHRDLKTSNLMIDSRGVVRLMDFGIAKEMGGDTTGATASGHIVGTPEYMSPEQAKGDKVDARSDLYSLGIVIFEVFTGDVPFKADTPLGTILKHLHDPPPLDEPGRLPAELVPVLRRALAKEPAERYASIEEVGSALNAARSTAFPGSPPVQLVATLRLAKAAQEAGRPTTPTPTRLPRVPFATPAPATPPSTVVGPQPSPPPPTQIMVTTPPPAPPPVEARRPAKRPPVRQPAPRRPALPVYYLGLSAVAMAGLVLAGRGVWMRVGVPVSAPAESTVGAPAEPPSARPLATSRPADSVEATPPPAAFAPAPSVAPTPPPINVRPADRPRPAPVPRPTPERLSTPVAALPAAPTTTLTIAPATTLPVAVPTAAPVVAQTPTPAPAPTPDVRGFLQLVVVPFAEATIDGQSAGRISSEKVPLAPGPHEVVLNHPDYQPLRRKITILQGETMRMVVDLAEEAVRKKK